MRGCFSISGYACLLGLIVLCMPLAHAAEKDELASARRLIDQVQMALERANIAEKQSDTSTLSRYDFDYSRIRSDLNTIKVGIDHYLMPSRDQPRDPVPISGDYRQEHPQ
ncbi:RAQPRD family integrative conjugative element protein [Xenorhabdus bovienii]|uniref:RAQPRD family integrative conjugative element protein n=2 Tax=Xenorhabdus bovienii TaxID=40576 RepID=A0AAJ1MXB6_XENBV|nr:MULTISPECIES: RAQPRD family integrative conjugative element protein [Xenorhabdus]MDE1476843.1 RAQPRD family integrative conjugative element protein [Xenorhabdus bovienii]MDE1486255.1 RAQPRD family integrative conjugative element protein [Xenorhabdus bovienii]MDE1496149.1 RAQPRD family integrative conjugative element protein [Xenorhabdus bovienii]MDE9472845.1 RAQPRD family integrative conjugative element protein [Xenorhabdus bovienii]MDE9476994.1 RAQPRD family integrative conjugative element